MSIFTSRRKHLGDPLQAPFDNLLRFMTIFRIVGLGLWAPLAAWLASKSH